MAVITKEEHARNQRRRLRQLLGLVVIALVLVGVVTVIRSGVAAVGTLFDETDARLEYEDKLEGLVLFDPLPFDGIETIDDLTLREAAVWGTVYAALDTQTGLDGYERDAETDQVMLPSVEVDAYLARIVGPELKMTHQSFDMEDMTISYDEASQCYLIPVTGTIGSYQAKVTDLFKKNGRLHVTVGYIPLASDSDITSTAAAGEPTKYMDYLFERKDGAWYLVGLADSETKPAPSATATPMPTPIDVTTDENLQNAIIAGVTGEDPSSAPSSEASSQADSASSEADSTAPEA